MTKIAFVFPGQGAQYVGMGKDIYDGNEVAKAEFDKIFSQLDFDLKEVMFNGPEETLKETKYTQPAIVAMSLILEKLLKEKGIKPDYVAGHSVGEYAALGAAGFLPIEETVKLTAARGKYMNEIAKAVNGTMAAIIGMDAESIKKVLDNIPGVVEAVNFNEPNQTVIAGEVKAVEAACIALKEAGARRAMILAVSGPFHSSLMKPVGEKLKKEVENYEIATAEIPLVTNTTVDIIMEPKNLVEEIYAQSFGPVKWVETIKTLKDNGVKTIYEIGPGKVLAGLIKKIDKEIEVINIEKLEDLNKI
jgi:[acyl-carrier-protein] S-malonyltransferase